MASIHKVIEEYDATMADKYDTHPLWKRYLVVTHTLALTLCNPRKDDVVLDAPVGTGLLARDLSEMIGDGGRLYGVDLSPAMLAKAKDRLEGKRNVILEEGDVTALSYPNSLFDKIYCINALQHFDRPHAFTSNAYRMLKPSGTLIVVDFDRSFISMKICRFLFRLRGDYFRSYTRKETERLLQNHGFSIMESISEKQGFWGYYAICAKK